MSWCGGQCGGPQATAGVEASGEDHKRLIEEVLASKRIELRGGRLLFTMTSGSMAFNLSMPGSDRDYFAVYAAHVGLALGATAPKATMDSHNPDLQAYEAAKYCELLLKGNPKVVEPLFAEHYRWESEEWQELKKLRHHLMTQVTVNQYVSYSLSQLGDYLKGKGDKPPAKRFYQALRLMQEAHHIICHRTPRLWYEEDCEERAFLLAIRRGEIEDWDGLVARLQALREQVDSLKSQLPEKTDPSVLNAWLAFLRRKQVADGSLGVVPNRLIPHSSPNSGALLLRDRALGILRRFDVKGEIVCCIPSGSRIHGLAVPTSSEDFVAIYASPTEEVVGTTPPPQRVDEVHGLVAHKQRESLARGLLLMEVGHACGLLAQGNHRLLEALFYSPPVASALEASKPPPMFETEAWQELREQALGSGGLISRATLQHYIGLAQAQLRAQPLTPLHLCHALRLLSEAQHMTDSCGPPRVRLPADEAVLLLRLRDGNGIIEEEKVLQEATAKAADLANKAKQANLPPSTDKTLLNRWLCSLRVSLL